MSPSSQHKIGLASSPFRVGAKETRFLFVCLQLTRQPHKTDRKLSLIALAQTVPGTRAPVLHLNNNDNNNNAGSILCVSLSRILSQGAHLQQIPIVHCMSAGAFCLSPSMVVAAQLAFK